MTAPTCPTCDGSGEVPVNPDAAWSGTEHIGLQLMEHIDAEVAA